jgi:hypothetical protein
MSVVRGHYGGAKAVMERRDPLPESELIEIRSGRMYADRLDGRPTAEIAKIFNLPPQVVNRQIKAIPESAKAFIRRNRIRGTQASMG